MAGQESAAIQRVAAALKAGGAMGEIRELSETARSAQDAAKALDCELGAIVKSLVFLVGETPVMALVAGDHRCRQDQLPRTLALAGEVRRPGADEVRALTGFSIGGVAPLGSTQVLPVAIDVSLRRFDDIYAAAGHPHCIFPTTVDELRRLTNGIISYAIAEPL
ncbi:MAG: YbaK/EbsC family protein [Magnetovibrionaceae bacterium]